MTTATLNANFAVTVDNGVLHMPDLNIPLKNINIPSSVTNLYLPYSYNYPMEKNDIPPSVTSIHFNDCYNCKIMPGVLPDSLREIYLTHYKYPLIPGIIPHGVTKLLLVEFNSTIQPDSLPNTLTELIIDGTITNLCKGVIPQSVKKLYMSDNKFTREMLPENLIEFTIPSSHKHDIEPGCLPPTITKLSIYNQKIIRRDVIPQSVVELSLYNCGQIDSDALPDRLEILNCNLFGNSNWSSLIMPTSCKSVVIVSYSKNIIYGNLTHVKNIYCTLDVFNEIAPSLKNNTNIMLMYMSTLYAPSTSIKSDITECPPPTLIKSDITEKKRVFNITYTVDHYVYNSPVVNNSEYTEMSNKYNETVAKYADLETKNRKLHNDYLTVSSESQYHESVAFEYKTKYADLEDKYSDLETKNRKLHNDYLTVSSDSQYHESVAFEYKTKYADLEAKYAKLQQDYLTAQTDASYFKDRYNQLCKLRESLLNIVDK